MKGGRDKEREGGRNGWREGGREIEREKQTNRGRERRERGERGEREGERGGERQKKTHCSFITTLALHYSSCCILWHINHMLTHPTLYKLCRWMRVGRRRWISIVRTTSWWDIIVGISWSRWLSIYDERGGRERGREGGGEGGGEGGREGEREGGRERERKGG